MTATSPKITITDLNVNFAERTTGKPIAALKDLTLSIGEGEFVCLVGPSGSGKNVCSSARSRPSRLPSTLLRRHG